jgi:hypothetical protein
MKKIIVAAAVSLFLSPAAFAAGSSTAAQGSPSDWNTQIKEAFFSDATSGKLLSQSEIKDNWSNLSSDQQAKVKSDCSNMQASADTTGKAGATAEAGSASNDKMASDQGSDATSSTDDNLATGSTSTSENSDTSGTSGASSTTSSMSSGDQMAAMQQVCGIVKDM